MEFTDFSILIHQKLIIVFVILKNWLINFKICNSFSSAYPETFLLVRCKYEVFATEFLLSS